MTISERQCTCHSAAVAVAAAEHWISTVKQSCRHRSRLSYCVQSAHNSDWRIVWPASSRAQRLFDIPGGAKKLFSEAADRLLHCCCLSVGPFRPGNYLNHGRRCVRLYMCYGICRTTLESLTQTMHFCRTTFQTFSVHLAVLVSANYDNKHNDCKLVSV